jgi:hypothetical protein
LESEQVTAPDNGFGALKPIRKEFTAVTNQVPHETSSEKNPENPIPMIRCE